VTLPISPPVEPMLAKSVAEIPVAAGMSYEPKWDGFRCIVFRDGDEVELASRGGKTLTRYFPEVVAQAKDQLPPRSVVDGEIVVIRRADGQQPKLDFELLGQRIHPAASRVNMLAETTPASFIAFDLLALDDENLMDKPFEERRAKLEQALKHVKAPVHLTPVSRDPEVGRHWFELFEGAGLDGIIAKPRDIPYEPGKRLMFKIKHSRTADAVVAGFRWHKSGPIIGSLLLGLYDDEGHLHHVGVSASFPMARRAELVDELAPYRENAAETHPIDEPARSAQAFVLVPFPRLGGPMKRTLTALVSAAVFASGAAFACDDMKAGGDDGYQASRAPDTQVAVVDKAPAPLTVTQKKVAKQKTAGKPIQPGTVVAKTGS